MGMLVSSQTYFANVKRRPFTLLLPPFLVFSICVVRDSVEPFMVVFGTGQTPAAFCNTLLLNN